MWEITSNLSSNKKDLRKTILILCIIFISEIAYSRNHWNRDYMKLFYNIADTSLVLRFEFFDYAFGPANEDGYLEYCDFAYSVDGVNYTNFMRSETGEQSFSWYDWSWVYMKNKLAGTKLQFNDCFSPPARTIWDDRNSTVLVKVYNSDTDYAWLTMKWFLNLSYMNVKYIRISGKWHINGVWPNDYFNEVYQTYLSDISELKAEVKPDTPQKNGTLLKKYAVKMYADADAVVIKGVERGEEIKVYSVSGLLVNTIISNNSDVKIKLTANQAYILKIGQSRYKLSL